MGDAKAARVHDGQRDVKDAAGTPFCESSARARTIRPPSSPRTQENTEKLRYTARLSLCHPVLDSIRSTAQANLKPNSRCSLESRRPLWPELEFLALNSRSLGRDSPKLNLRGFYHEEHEEHEGLCVQQAEQPNLLNFVPFVFFRKRPCSVAKKRSALDCGARIGLVLSWHGQNPH